jgi:mRNA interferase MazF
MDNVRRGDIWYADLDGIGSEQKGIKTVVVIQNNTGNLHSPTIIVAVITSKQKAGHLPTHARIWARCPSVIMSEQLKTIDKSRLLEKIGYLKPKEIERLDETLKISIGL